MYIDTHTIAACLGGLVAARCYFAPCRQKKKEEKKEEEKEEALHVHVSIFCFVDNMLFRLRGKNVVNDRGSNKRHGRQALYSIVLQRRSV